MRKRKMTLIAVFAIMVLVLPLSSISLAQESGDALDRTKLTYPRPTLGPAVEPEAGQPEVDRIGQLSRRGGPLTVMIELSDAPTSRVFAERRNQVGAAAATTAAQTQLARIEVAQQRVLTSLRPMNARVLYRVQRVLNGIAVRVDARHLEAIERIPGVKAVRAITPKYRSNASSVPLIGAPELWAAGNNLTGEGMTIGVIDTGIDYLHTDFGGSGNPADYERNNTTVAGDVGFPSVKVVGGYDFAGDAYDASSDDGAAQVPNPDPDPMDCNGHGTHVAGTAAGYGVNPDGSTYTGPYSPATPFSSLRIGPGVAPLAQLYALRVFGCDGSTDLTEMAIEWSVDPNGDGDFSDRLDVINMSLGSNYGAGEDTSTTATNNAVLAGVIVVTSAGNSGDTYYITGAPGVSDRAISTASTVDAVQILDGFRVNTPAEIAGVHPASQSTAYDWSKPPVTAQLAYPASQASGCQTFNAENAALLQGKIALLDWTELGPGVNECGSVARAANALAAGAVGVIMIDNSEVFDLRIFGSPVIPSVSTPLQVGNALKAHLDEGVSVTLTAEYANSQRFEDPSIVDTLSGFSSRGVGRGGIGVKPDIAAPGDSIFSAAALTGNEGASFNGTSMAAPHVAGSMALLKQLHPDWTVEELKALAMNTANSPVRSAIDPASPIFGPSRVGAGRITLQEAIASDVIVLNAEDEGVVSVSFGVVEVLDAVTMVKTVRVVNKGSVARTYNVAYAPTSDTPGVEFTILGESSVTVAANSTATIRVQMQAQAEQMRNTRDVTVSGNQGLDRAWLSEEAGYLMLTPSGSTAVKCGLTGELCPDLRVPLYAAPRAASNMRAAQSNLDFKGGTTGEIRLAGQGINDGTNHPEDVISLVTALELQAIDPNDLEVIGLSDNADIQYVGVSTDAPAAGSFEDSRIFFGVTTHSNWATPNTVEFDIFLDTNRDGEDDYLLFNFNTGSATGGNATDVFVSVLFNLKTNKLVLQDYLNGVPPSVLGTVLFNTNMMILPVYAADLGLTADNAAFNYRVVSFAREAEDEVDVVEGLTYNAAQPGLDFSNGFAGVTTFADLPGEVIPVVYNQTAFTAANSKGILLLHHHNVAGNHAEVVVIGPARMYLPLVFR